MMRTHARPSPPSFPMISTTTVLLPMFGSIAPIGPMQIFSSIRWTNNHLTTRPIPCGKYWLDSLFVEIWQYASTGDGAALAVQVAPGLSTQALGEALKCHGNVP